MEEETEQYTEAEEHKTEDDPFLEKLNPLKQILSSSRLQKNSWEEAINIFLEIMRDFKLSLASSVLGISHSAELRKQEIDEIAKQSIYDFQKELSAFEKKYPDLVGLDETTEIGMREIGLQIHRIAEEFAKLEKKRRMNVEKESEVYIIQNEILLLERALLDLDFHKPKEIIIKGLMRALETIKKIIPKFESEEHQKEMTSNVSSLPVKKGGSKFVENTEFRRFQAILHHLRWFLYKLKFQIINAKEEHVKEVIDFLEMIRITHIPFSIPYGGLKVYYKIPIIAEIMKYENMLKHLKHSLQLLEDKDESSDFSAGISMKKNGSNENTYREMLHAFQKHIESATPCEEILSACIQRTNEDIPKINVYSSQELTRFEKISRKFIDTLSIHYHDKKQTDGILKRSTRVLESIMTSASKIRLATASVCFASSVGVLMMNNKASLWRNSLIAVSFSCSAFGLLMTMMEKTFSRHTLKDAAEYIVSNYNRHKEMVHDIYQSHVNCDRLPFSQHIDWETVMQIHEYFESNDLKRLRSYRLLLSNNTHHYMMDSSTMLYFTLLFSCSSKNFNILKDEKTLRELLIFSTSTEGIMLWQCMTLRYKPNFWTLLILSLDMFPKRQVLFFQAFHHILNSLHSSNPLAAAWNLFFCVLTAFDGFRDLRKGVNSKQLFTLRQLHDCMLDENQQLEKTYDLLNYSLYCV